VPTLPPRPTVRADFPHTAVHKSLAINSYFYKAHTAVNDSHTVSTAPDGRRGVYSTIDSETIDFLVDCDALDGTPSAIAYGNLPHQRPVEDGRIQNNGTTLSGID
jgi:hypothetical protein